MTQRDAPSEANRPADDYPHSPVITGSDTARAFAAKHCGAVKLGVPSLVWGSGQERRLLLIQSHIPLEGRRILDVGCGVGQYVQRLQELPTAAACGIDIERDRVAQGAQHVPDLLLASAESLPFCDGAFDVVLLNEVLEHVGDDRQAVVEATRILPVGGHIVVYAPNRWFPFETHGIYWRGRYHFGNYPLINYLPNPVRNRLVPHARAYSGVQLHSLRQGLPLRLVARGAVYPGFDGIHSRNPRVGQLLQSTLHRAERTPLRTFGLSHFLIWERVATP